MTINPGDFLARQRTTTLRIIRLRVAYLDEILMRSCGAKRYMSVSTIVFKKNGPTRGGYKCKFQREVHKSKLNAIERVQC